ncbi:MAG: hypothetical protein BTN85_0437 [Candidatus Methanohalarchaeum thermophilum]|uniref:Uncharacterized protein n=1 Tax=Methanohalarchaeum thermophilum TaxID=1903181 RepID=A0A1Q6DUA4_METT1|nr:MAG: hypothetical protein BTN85_0437 [Candidatus Methanohalarchaeum thermophilum]
MKEKKKAIYTIFLAVTLAISYDLVIAIGGFRDIIGVFLLIALVLVFIFIDNIIEYLYQPQE